MRPIGHVWWHHFLYYVLCFVAVSSCFLLDFLSASSQNATPTKSLISWWDLGWNLLKHLTLTDLFTEYLRQSKCRRFCFDLRTTRCFCVDIVSNCRCHKKCKPQDWWDPLITKNFYCHTVQFSKPEMRYLMPKFSMDSMGKLQRFPEPTSYLNLWSMDGREGWEVKWMGKKRRRWRMERQRSIRKIERGSFPIIVVWFFTRKSVN